jgi:hypothetical protein
MLRSAAAPRTKNKDAPDVFCDDLFTTTDTARHIMERFLPLHPSIIGVLEGFDVALGAKREHGASSGRQSNPLAASAARPRPHPQAVAFSLLPHDGQGTQVMTTALTLRQIDLQTLAA